MPKRENEDLDERVCQVVGGNPGISTVEVAWELRLRVGRVSTCVRRLADAGVLLVVDEELYLANGAELGADEEESYEDPVPVDVAMRQDA